MSLGWAAVEQGIRDEDFIAAELAARGWQTIPFGQRCWDPQTCEWGRQDVIDAVRRSVSPLRHAPDLVAARSPMAGAWLIEVVRNRHEDKRCMEIAKLVSLSAWVNIAPVVVVDAEHMTAWRHRPGWAYKAVTDVSRKTRVGSGDPYAWFKRDDELPFDSIFGGVK